MICRAARLSDISGILVLQSKHLFANLSEAERLRDGFVTTPFTTDQLTAIINADGGFVAESGGKIVGYTFAGSWDFFGQWPIFPVMATHMPGLVLAGLPLTVTNTFQYGPICIGLDQRGSGAFERLFDVMRLGWQGRHRVGVTFINKANGRSYAAHTRKLGMVTLAEFDFNQNHYHLLGFDTTRSVLNL